jgi:Anti-sigma-K factor rskA
VAHLDPELLALIALGEEQPDAAGHLAGCPQCQAEAEQLRAVVTLARRDGRPAELTAPPPALWNRIAAAAGVSADPVPETPAGTGRPDGDQGGQERAGRTAADGPGREARPAWWRRRPLVTGIAAAVAGLLIGIGATAGISQVSGPPAAHVVAHITLRPLPAFPQWKDASGTAVMRTGSAGRQLSVVLHAPQRAGYYEVWLLARDGVSMISLGDLGPRRTGRFDMPPGVDLARYSRIDISLQPFNGSTQHSRVSVVRGQIP